MPRLRIDPSALDALLAIGEQAAPLEQKVEQAVAWAQQSGDGGRFLLHFLLDYVQRGRIALEEASETQQKLRQLIELFDQPPWHPAIFQHLLEGSQPARALVVLAGQSRVVSCEQELDPASLACGDEVFLSKDQNLIMARSPYGLPTCGETAFFERLAGASRCVLRSRDEEIVVDMAEPLRATALERGDQVRWNRSAWMALEKIERAAGQEFFLEEVEQIDSDQVGGQDEALTTVLSVLSGALLEPALAQLYDLNGCQSLLMEGPPGCGKTLMAKAAAAMVRQISGRSCRFAVVKPGEWLSPWVGETELKIRQTFKALSEAAREAHAILFLDEVESIGRIRGGTTSHHGDAALACLLAELNGFKQRGNVAIIAATNRKDLVDPALLERLSDVEVRVRRPDAQAARAIFAIHLDQRLPYGDPRSTIVDAAVAMLYSPNADNEVCTLRFRDGKSRVVAARELASGRSIAQICSAARRNAFDRHCRNGDPGVRLSDIQDAVADALLRSSTTLTRHNVHAYLSDLPQDVDVVAVEPIRRRVQHPHRYLQAA